MKQINEIYNDIKNFFYDKTKISIKRGTVFDFFTLAISKGIYGAYEEIEKNKNPYIFTGDNEINLEGIGEWVHCVREVGEDFKTFQNKLLNWTYRNEASNKKAIETSLNGPFQYTSSAEYIPYTEGVGTATIYIIPKEYNENIMNLAIEEVKNTTSRFVSPSSYIKYLIPQLIPVRLIIFIGSKKGNITDIKKVLQKKIENYINSIPPKHYLYINDINKIGINEPLIDYFNVNELFINDSPVKDIKILQQQNIKFLFEYIVWWEVD